MYKIKGGYIAFWSKDRKRIFEHHLLLPKKPGFEIDHKDGNPSNNNPSNLRYSTHSQNMQNQRKQNRITSSKYKGVSWSKQHSKWKSYIKHNGKLIYLGYSKTEFEAAKKYDRKARELFGEFSKCNFAADSTVHP